MSDSTELLSVEQSDTLQQLKSLKNGGQVAESEGINDGEHPKVAATAAEAPAEARAEDAPAEGNLRIGDKEFKTYAEAFAYANSLEGKNETEKLINDAYRQGIQDAASRGEFSQSVTQAALPKEEEDPEFETKFFANPREFLKNYATKVKTEAREDALNTIRAEQAEANAWAEFYARYPDLEGFTEDCSSTLARERDAIQVIAKSQGKDKAMDYLARKTRAKFQTYIERTAQKRTLPNASTQPTPSSGQRVTPSSVETPAVDFVSEMRQNRAAKNVRS